MIEDQQFTVSMRHYQNTSQIELELFCNHLLPGMQFRFASFEKNDYRKGDITCYLYNRVPDSVFFTVETPEDIEPALEKLVAVNPGVEWYWAAVNYINYDKSGDTCISIELHLLSIPMRVNPDGEIICKQIAF